MPTRTHNNRTNGWQARGKCGRGVRYTIGLFKTKRRAELSEQLFRHWYQTYSVRDIDKAYSNIAAIERRIDKRLDEDLARIARCEERDRRMLMAPATCHRIIAARSGYSHQDKEAAKLLLELIKEIL